MTSDRTDSTERNMRKALGSLRNLTQLAENPLVERITGDGNLDIDQRARRLQAWLFDAVDSLKPNAPGAGTKLQDAHLHELLDVRYVQGLKPVAAQNRLKMPKATFFTHSREAIYLLASKFSNEFGAALESPDQHLPTVESKFVGRIEETVTLKSLYHQVSSGDGGRIVTITGDEGIGKTRLARELGRYAERNGGLFLEGRWAPRDKAAPYGAIGECLRLAIRQLEPSEIEQVIDPYRADLARIEPELALNSIGIDTDLDIGTEGQQLRFFDSVFRVMQFLSEKQPLVLLLDDLHLSPQMNMQLHLARRLSELRLLMVYTFMENELVSNPALVAGRKELDHTRLLTDLHIKPLTEAEVAEVITNAFGPQVAQKITRPVFEKNPGNPFILEEMLRYLVQNQVIKRLGTGWEIEDISVIPIPRAVRTLVHARVQKLGQPAVDVLRMASVFDGEFRLDVLKRMAGLDYDELAEIIEEAEANDLIVDITGNTPIERFRFRDEHVQEALYTEIPDIRKRRYHREAGKALEQITPELVYELAYHFRTGAEAEAGARYSLQAADQASNAFNWNRAIPLYRDTLDLLGSLGGHIPERASTAESLGNACYKSGQQAERASEYFREALDLYRQLDNKPKIATVLSELGRDYMHGGNLLDQDLNLAAEHFVDAISLMEGEPEGVRHGMAFCGLAMAQLDMMNFSDALEWANRAYELGERINAPAVIANASVPLGAATAMESLSDAADILERGWKLSVDSNLGFQADLARAYAARVFGAMPKDPRTGIEWVNRGPRYETTYSLFDIPAHLVAFHALTGELETAAIHLDELHTRLATLGQPAYGPWPDELGLYWIRTGNLEHAESQLSQAVSWSERSGNRLVQAGTSRRLAEVLRYLDRYSESEKYFLHSLELNRSGRNRMGEMALLPHLAMLYCKMGRPADATQALGKAREISTTLDEPGALSGDLLIAEAVIHASKGRLNDSEIALVGASEVYERFERPWDQARGRYLLAEMYAESGDARDLARSRELFAQATAEFIAIGASWWAERSQQKS